MYMNCVERLRRCVRKESEEQEGRGIYIVNLVARLTVLYCALSWFWRNSIEFNGLDRIGRLWQISVENGRLWWIAVDYGGICGRLWWRQVESRWRVYKVSRRCPVTCAKK